MKFFRTDAELLWRSSHFIYSDKAVIDINSNGQLGDGTTTNRYAPAAVSGVATATAAVAAGNKTAASCFRVAS